MAEKQAFIQGRKPITFVDLFAGAGGISEGFMQAYTDTKYYDLIASYSESERRQYEESKKVFWDNYSVIKTAVRKGVKQEKIDTIHRLHAMGLTIEQIAQGSDMNVEDVKKLLE